MDQLACWRAKWFRKLHGLQVKGLLKVVFQMFLPILICHQRWQLTVINLKNGFHLIFQDLCRDVFKILNQWIRLWIVFVAIFTFVTYYQELIMKLQNNQCYYIVQILLWYDYLRYCFFRQWTSENILGKRLKIHQKNFFLWFIIIYLVWNYHLLQQIWIEIKFWLIFISDIRTKKNNANSICLLIIWE